MILAAGRGERMRPLTDHTPKSMLPVGGKPLIFRHLEKLADAGFGSVVINHAHLGEQIESAVGDGDRWNLEIRFSPEAQALETAGGIRNALPLLREQVFAVVNADVYSDYDYARLAEAHSEHASRQRSRISCWSTIRRIIRKEIFPWKAIWYMPAARDCSRSAASAPIVQRCSIRSRPGAGTPLAPLLREQMVLGKITGEHFRGEWDDIGRHNALPISRTGCGSGATLTPVAALDRHRTGRIIPILLSREFPPT